MAPICPLLALRRALHCQITASVMVASTDTIPMCTGTFLLPPYFGVSSFSIATIHKAYHTESGGFKAYPYLPPLPPKPPQIIAWHPLLCNRISLLGTLMQHVDITYLDSGHTRGTSTLKMSNGDGSYTLFKVELWDELAEIAAAHMKVGNYVHVAGILHVVNTLDEAYKTNLQWKVTATKLNFVRRTPFKDEDLRINYKNTQKNIQVVDENIGKSPVKDDGLRMDEDMRMNCECTKENIQVVEENIETSSEKDDCLRMNCESTQENIGIVEENIEKSPVKDDCLRMNCEGTQKVILAVDDNIEKTPVQERKVAEQQADSFF